MKELNVAYINMDNIEKQNDIYIVWLSYFLDKLGSSTLSQTQEENLTILILLCTQSLDVNCIRGDKAK